MVLPIVQYGHPVLRQKGLRIPRLTPELRQLIDDMLETMHDASGVGLAAQQVGQAIQLTVLDIRGIEDRPSTLQLNRQEVRPEAHMPLVLINPEITPLGDPVAGPEGCLSFPEIYAEIIRPASVKVRATNERGEPIEFEAGGLLARAVQHEYDHLQGILFIDRMSADTRRQLKPDLDALQASTKAALKRA